MKNLKVALFGLLIATIGMLAATNASAQTTIKYFVWKPSVPVFNNGQPDSSPLVVLGNYTLQATSANCPTSTLKFCEIQISYPTSGGTPTDQGIVNALRAKYIAQGNTFTDGQSFVVIVDGVSVTFTIQLKP